MKEQEERNIAVRNTTKYTILKNFMVVILNRGLDYNNHFFKRTQYISEIRRFYNEWEDCGILPTVKIFLEIF